MDNDTATGLKWLIGFFVLVIVLAAGGWLLSVALSDPVGRGEAYKQVHGDATYRNQQHNHFYDLCAGVQAAETRIEVAKQQLKADIKAGADAATIRRDQENVNGPTGQRADLITQYNADADNIQTKGLFRDINLPAHLDVNQEKTTCAS